MSSAERMMQNNSSSSLSAKSSGGRRRGSGNVVNGNTSSGGGGGRSVASGSAKSETVAYLMTYEGMVRHQDYECEATNEHIRQIVERIRFLGRKSGSRQPAGTVGTEESDDADGASRPPSPDVPQGMLTYAEMRRCLLRLGYTWCRWTNVGEDCEDVSVLSGGSGSTGGWSGSATHSMLAGVRDIICTDSQLIMLLTTLVEAEERFQAEAEEEGFDGEDGGPALPNLCDEDDGEGAFRSANLGLFLPEFIQAYKIVIGGMQALQTVQVVSPPPNGLPADAVMLSAISARSRERSLGLLRLFGPGQRGSSSHGEGGSQSAGEASPNKQKNRSLDAVDKPRIKQQSKGLNAKSKTVKDGLLPRLTEEDIHKLIHTKDQALATILEEHQVEMSAMASNMRAMELKKSRTERQMRRRQKATWIVVAVLAIAAATGGAAWEFLRREDVAQEIAAGREAKTRSDADNIARLGALVRDLDGQLTDAKALERLAEARLRMSEEAVEEAQREYEQGILRWGMEKQELERCRVGVKERETDFIRLRKSGEEKEEAMQRCHTKLASTERELEGLERSVMAAAAAERREAIIEDDDGEGDSDDVDSDRYATDILSPLPFRKKNLPIVRLEMKYNPKFKSAVVLRQFYAAMGGVLAMTVFPPVLSAAIGSGAAEILSAAIGICGSLVSLVAKN